MQHVANLNCWSKFYVTQSNWTNFATYKYDDIGNEERVLDPSS